MHKYTRYSILFVFVLALLASSCKKETTPEVYFTTSSATGEAGGSPSTVTIEFSKPTEEIVEIDFESVGADPIRFGSYHQAFSRDDSEKCQVTIDNQAFIDTMGHIKVTMGVKKLTVTFTPQFDNFPHAAASYAVKMTQAKGADIRPGSDVFTYNIGSTKAKTLVTSQISTSSLELTRWFYNDTVYVDSIVSRAGSFGLSEYAYSKNLSGGYDLTLSYVYSAGNTHARTVILSYNIPALPEGDTVLSCTNSTLSGDVAAFDINTVGAFTRNLNCPADVFSIPLQVNKHHSPVYGAYYTLSGSLEVQSPGFNISGSLKSDFILFD